MLSVSSAQPDYQARPDGSSQWHSGTAFGLLSDQLARERLRDFSAAFIFVHELSREIIGKGSYLERESTAARVNGVQLDPIKLIIGEDRDELPGLEFGPAHPSRGERYSEPRFGAGDDAVGRGDLIGPSTVTDVACPERVKLQPVRPERPGPRMQSCLARSAGVCGVPLRAR